MQQCLLASPNPVVVPDLAAMEAALRTFVFPDLFAGKISLYPAAFLPLTLTTIPNLPSSLRPILDDSYLPVLSSRFAAGASDPADTSSVTIGITLLALYFTIYPGNHPLIG